MDAKGLQKQIAIRVRTWLLAVACALALCPALQSQANTSPSSAKQADTSVRAKKCTVKQLDGTKLVGFVEVTDDYTIRVSNDWGIIRLPIAELGDADFRKHGFKKDRSKDGRFWYERKEALNDLKADRKSKNNVKSGEKSSVEIRLAEISAFQPFIAAYEKTLAAKESEKSSTINKPREKTETLNKPFTPMPSEPRLGGPLSQAVPSLGN
jgi:hypothetical protein